jgi:uncharacterized membrane protein YccC
MHLSDYVLVDRHPNEQAGGGAGRTRRGDALPQVTVDDFIGNNGGEDEEEVGRARKTTTATTENDTDGWKHEGQQKKKRQRGSCVSGGGRLPLLVTTTQHLEDCNNNARDTIRQMKQRPRLRQNTQQPKTRTQVDVVAAHFFKRRRHRHAVEVA